MHFSGSLLNLDFKNNKQRTKKLPSAFEILNIAINHLDELLRYLILIL